jgi:hypothetical protein
LQAISLAAALFFSTAPASSAYRGQTLSRRALVQPALQQCRAPSAAHPAGLKYSPLSMIVDALGRTIMSSTRVRLWDAGRHEAYVKERDQALERRLDEREGTSIARDIDSIWAQLPQDERDALLYLSLSDARSCVGNCSDPLLAGLVAKGLLIWPPGVRPVLTDDLVTSFLMPPAIWEVFQTKRDDFAIRAGGAKSFLEAAEKKFEGHFTPLVTSEITSDPFRPSTGGDGKS